MNTWGQRLEMAQRGWSTKIVIQGAPGEDGLVTVMASVSRAYWAGDRIDLNFHDTADVRVSDVEMDNKLQEQITCLQEATTRAERDFSTVVPCQLPDRLEDGRLNLVLNSRATEDELRAPREDYMPTERLPEDLDGWFKAGSDDALEHLVAASLRGFDIEDSFDPGFSPAPRMPYDCQNRDWGYRLRLRKLEHLGEPLAHQREQFTTKHFNEVIVSGVILGAVDGLDQLFEMYPDSMPPGFMSRADKLAQDDRRSAPGHTI